MTIKFIYNNRRNITIGKKFNQYSKFGIKFLESYNGFLAWSYSKHKYVNSLAVLQDGSYVQIVDGVATPVDDVIYQFNETGYEEVPINMYKREDK